MATQADKQAISQKLDELDTIMNQYNRSAAKVKLLNQELQGFQDQADAKRLEIKALMTQLGALPEA